jgi:hypothetical protein
VEVKKMLGWEMKKTGGDLVYLDPSKKELWTVKSSAPVDGWVLE